MIIIEEHLTIQYILIALELNIFQKKLKNVITKQKYNNKYLENTSKPFDNVWIFCIGFIDFMLHGQILLE